MKTNYTATETAAAGAAFTIAATGKAFKILSDGLYSDKIRAIVRELACNARDSHTAAGTTQPWELHLPTDSERWFEIRDFGTGLSHEDVTNIYTRYFASTKTDSNAYVGQLGLGSKSPFSYVREFQVRSYHGGVCNTYRMSYDDTDTPRVELLNTEKSSTTGLAVRFKTGYDASRWHEKAGAVLQWFDQLPVMTGASVEIEKPEPVWQGKGWRLFRSTAWYAQDAAAIMGGVVYPISISSITGDITDSQDQLLNMPVLIDFDIGELDVAASREGLSYDNRTVANIKAKVDDVVIDLQTRFKNEISGATSEWQARRSYNLRMTKSHSAYYLKQLMENFDLKWNDIEIKSSFLSMKHEDLYGNNSSNIVRSIYRGGKATSIINNNISLNCDDSTVIFFNDLGKGAVSRVKNFHQQTGATNNILMFDPSDTLSWTDMAAAIGGCPYRLVSTLAAAAPAVKKGTVNCWKMSRGFGRSAWLPVVMTDELTSSSTKYFIDMNKWDPLLPSGHMTTTSTVAGLINVLFKLQLVPDNIVIYGIRAQGKKALEKHGKNWVNFVKFAEDKLNSSAIRKQINDAHAAAALHSSIREMINNSALTLILDNANPEWIDRIIDPESDIIKLITGFNSIKAIKRMNDTDAAIINRIVPDIIQHDTEASDLLALCQRVNDKYSMLAYARHVSWSNRNAELAKYINMVDHAYEFVNLSSRE